MRRILSILTVAALAAAFAASAADLGVTGATIQAGEDDNLQCDTDGVIVNWGLETDDNEVRNVRVSQISSACEGARMIVHVTTASGVTQLVADPLTGAIQETIPFSTPYPTPEEITAVKVWIEG